VIAYLQMLRAEINHQPYNKSEVRRALLAGPLKGRTTSEQRMQNISAVLEQMKRPWIPGYKPLGNIGRSSKIRLEAAIRRVEDGTPFPRLPPPAPKPDRKLPATGYWLFVCNRRRWAGEDFLRTGDNRLLYMVSDHHRTEVKPGDLGVLRINAGSGRPACVYALVEVETAPTLRTDDDERFYADPSDAHTLRWRSGLRLIANLIDNPIRTDTLPDEEAFLYLKRPLMTSTIPLGRLAFDDLFRRSQVEKLEVEAARSVDTPEDVRQLELASANLDPKRRERVSQVIERGSIGEKVKVARGHRCQLCECQGQSPIAFFKAGGTPYAEAHHVRPVSLLLAGLLSPLNIMVLCPNHHRQVHYGDFEVLEEAPRFWKVRLDGEAYEVPRTELT